MPELCFNTMNRSAFFLGDEDPDLPGQIDAAAAAGFGLFGADHDSIQAFVARGGTLAGLAERIEAAGMRSFELPTLMVTQQPEEVDRAVASMLPVVEALRPDFVQVNVLSQVDADTIEGFRRAAARFAECGARLAVESLPWLPEIRNLASTRRMLERAGIEGAGVLVDVWHFTHSDDRWDELEALPLDEISYVQFDDHPPLESDDLVAETIGRRVMPGEGVFELERFCDVIRSKGFDGVVSCEILSEQTRQMELAAFARQVHESCARFWS